MIQEFSSEFDFKVSFERYDTFFTLQAGDSKFNFTDILYCINDDNGDCTIAFLYFTSEYIIKFKYNGYDLKKKLNFCVPK